ncbi:MAG: YjgN family protein [Proteobacteria bacterium]|nr:YjgN family protein [Pseudomonadota bacterium]
METNQREYALVFQGQVTEGQDVEEVKARFTESMRCDPAKTETLFTGRRLLIKRFPTKEAAEQGALWLRQLGMVLEVIAVEKKEDTQAASALEQTRVSPPPPEPPLVPPSATEEPPATLPHGPEIWDETPSRPQADAERRLPFVFNGQGSEFFKIWIVNMLLSIITLGIWSAWAKVRTKRYFYGNTSLDGSGFEYLADPVKILKGRLLVFGVFAAFSLITKFYPLFNLIGGLLFLLLTPWIVRQSLRFQRHYTAWRGVRFAFVGTLGDASRAFVLWPTLTVLLFFLPAIWHRQTHYLIDHSCYGSTRLVNRSTIGNFFVVFGLLALLALLLSTVTAIMIPLIGLDLMTPSYRSQPGEIISAWLVILPLMTLVWIIMAALYKVRMVNLRLGKTEIGPHRIVTRYTFGSYLWLVLTNTLGVMLSLGMFYPFAKVRAARYAAERTEMVIQGDLDHFVASHQAEVSALGGEAADFFDMDIGF